MGQSDQQKKVLFCGRGVKNLLVLELGHQKVNLLKENMQSVLNTTVTSILKSKSSFQLPVRLYSYFEFTQGFACLISRLSLRLVASVFMRHLDKFLAFNWPFFPSA